MRKLKGENGGFRFYDTREQREQAFKELKDSGKWNYFFFYKDVNGWALNYSKVDWLPEGKFSIQR